MADDTRRMKKGSCPLIWKNFASRPSERNRLKVEIQNFVARFHLGCSLKGMNTGCGSYWEAKLSTDAVGVGFSILFSSYSAWSVF